MREPKQPAVYIMASERNGTLYVGVSSHLQKRVYEHRTSATDSFSAQHGCKTLVWYELHEDMTSAITREKQLKAGSRKKKLAFVEAMNPEWLDLFESIL